MEDLMEAIAFVMKGLGISFGFIIAIWTVLHLLSLWSAWISTFF